MTHHSITPTPHWTPHGGYDAKNKDALDKRFKCLICDLILRDPVQLDCGHRICRSCVPDNKKDLQCRACLETTSSVTIRRDIGHEKEMQTLPILCTVCEWSGELQHYEAHLETLHKQNTCPYCQEVFHSFGSFNYHKQEMCPQMPMNCVLQNYGCKEQFTRREKSQHYQSEIHQRILLLLVLQMLTVSHPKLQQSKQGLPSASTTTSMATENDVEPESVKEVIDLFASGTEGLSDDLQTLGRELLRQSGTIEATSERLNTLKTSCQESTAMLHARMTNITILRQECTSLEHRVADMQQTSYDGTFVWKITDFNQKMTDAQSDLCASIYSPPFYSSRTGYKMCVRLYPFGDGNARRTHMSLFFVLMRGPHDAVLKFPFNYKVTFCLFDQSDRQQHVIDSFRPDERSSSFQRPRCHMNIASGIPKFVSLGRMEQPDTPFIRNNTVFIRVAVDFENLPKTLLPYTMSLNPGLPIDVQQKMIRDEIARREQVGKGKNDEKHSVNQQQLDCKKTTE